MKILKNKVMNYEYSPNDHNYTEKLKSLIDSPPPSHRISLKNGSIIDGTIEQDTNAINIGYTVGGMTIGQFYEGRERYPIRVRYKKELRDRIDELKKGIDRNKESKLHMEDMCQITERLTEHKYNGSYEQIAKAIKKYSSNPASSKQYGVSITLPWSISILNIAIPINK